MRVHILLATYNGEKYLADQLDSILSQTYKDFRLLIRDDGSSDQTLAIISEYVQKDERITWVNPDGQDNIGVIESFYQLTKYQDADIYLFSDQDDVWQQDKVARQVECLQEESASQPSLVYMDLSVTDSQLVVQTASMIRRQSGHANTRLVEELTENTVTGGVVAFNHALAELWTTTDQIIMHDWYLALIAAAKGKLIYLDQVGELYRQHASNVLGARTLKKRLRRWLQPSSLFASYWDLIRRSQAQAKTLLDTVALSDEDKELVQAFVTIMTMSYSERRKALKKYGLKKNKPFHTMVFRSLILTKFLYKES